MWVLRGILLMLSFGICSAGICAAQAPLPQQLPNAPSPKNLAVVPSPPAGQLAAGPNLLTRQQAEQIALANNPRIQISQLLAKVQHQVVRERRADELLNLNGELTAVSANEASRISTGSLAASRLLEHAGMGIQLSQLITDFGHAQNLVASARLQEKARLADVEASREDIILATDQVFFHTIEAQATLSVAQQTVAARQSLVDQVSALTVAKLKSDLDLSFVQVNLSQAKLLQIDAQNNLDASKAALNEVLGYDTQTDFQLVEDDSGSLPALSSEPESLVVTALDNRPDLQSLRFDEQAAQKFSRAQRDQLLPTITALGVIGATPLGSSQYFTTNWYGAIGANVNVPIFNGFRYHAQAEEAALQSKAASEKVRRLRDQVVRDVKVAWLNANTALQRVTVAAELLKQANLALDLAQTRYQLGLSSIVELSQAQLQQTQAAIGNANARSQYGFATSELRFQMGVQP
ncbi:TolC family protein [Edaphobacter albus]|uniref:TolC family protein n=1 Tax=Edaphobacter sp. 4G125 TaxID=2763071 RepID=UPI001646E5D0|nr:TolC family protein [Edaphobacter sp. 4G125]QNI35679.1 TolC family protein [Edaphobacter sp. 4G125]